jgi:hypothetical protein
MSLLGYLASWEFWRSIVAGVVGGGGAVGLLGKMAMAKYKANLAQELEGWKAGYQKALDENRIRFSWYHLERAKAIKNLYSQLSVAEEALGSYVSQKGLPEKESAQQQLGKAERIFKRNRIFFTDDECQSIKECLEWILNALIHAQASNVSQGINADEIANQRFTARNIVSNKIPKLRQTLEKRFKIALSKTDGRNQPPEES